MSTPRNGAGRLAQELPALHGPRPRLPPLEPPQVARAGAAALPPLARLPVVGIAVGTAALLFALAGRYGYDGDELYFIMAGRRPDWGYADQPPGVPLLALLADTLAPGSLHVLRAPAILATAAGIVLAALLAREFGGNRRAQWWTAAAYALAFGSLGRMLSTTAFDLPLWTLLTWLVVRWVRLHRQGVRQDRWLCAAVGVVAVALQIKFQIAVFCAALLVAALVSGPRRLLARPALWVGAVLVTLSAAPALHWQYRHDWPQLRMAEAIAAEVSQLEGTTANLALMLLGLGPVFGLVLGLYGLGRLLAAGQEDYRFLAVASLLVTAFVVLSGGRAYYIYGVFPALWAAGAVGFQRRRPAGSARTGRRAALAVAPALAVSALWPLADLPLQPRESYVGKPPQRFDKRSEVGWPELADQIAGIHRRLPGDRRDRAVVMSDDYWVASALEYFGPGRGLPPVHSGSRGYWFFGAPAADRDTLIYVGVPEPAVRAHFGVIRQIGTVDNGLRIDTDYQGRPIFLISRQKQPWPEIWPEFQRLNLLS